MKESQVAITYAEDRRRKSCRLSLSNHAKGESQKHSANEMAHIDPSLGRRVR